MGRVTLGEEGHEFGWTFQEQGPLGLASQHGGEKKGAQASVLECGMNRQVTEQAARPFSRSRRKGVQLYSGAGDDPLSGVTEYVTLDVLLAPHSKRFEALALVRPLVGIYGRPQLQHASPSLFVIRTHPFDRHESGIMSCHS